MSNNKDYLSQEEIDALLKQTMEDDSSSSNKGISTDTDDYLTSLEQDALGEIGNITFGSAATALSTLLGKKVDITTPKVSVIAKDELGNEFPHPHVAVHVKYVDGFQGINLLVIKTSDAQVIADLMLGGDGTVPPAELNEIHISAVQEAMNQMMGSSATSMSTIFNRFVNISPPGIDIFDVSQDAGDQNFPAENVLIKISFRLIIEELIDSNIMQLIPVSFAKDMVSILMGGSEAQAAPQEAAQPMEQPAAVATSIPAPSAMAGEVQVPMQQPPAANYQQPPAVPQYTEQPPMYQQPMPQYQPAMQQPPVPPQPQYRQPVPSQHEYGMMNQRDVNVQPVQYTNFTPGLLQQAEQANLNLLLDIPLNVTVELGRTQKLIKEILELSQGSIIELDKLAGEPVDILVNNKLIAKGEVVVIDENFGVRVTDIMSQWDRIQKLQ